MFVFSFRFFSAILFTALFFSARLPIFYVDIMFYIYFFLGAHQFFLQINTLILIKGLDAFPFKLHLNFDLKSYQKSFQKNNVTVSSSTCYREGGPPDDHKDRKLLKWRGRQGLAQH